LSAPSLPALAALAFAGFAAPVAAQPAMPPMAALQGCWHGQFEGAPGMTDERCIAPMLGGQFVRDTHTVHGGEPGYGGETIYARDPVSHRIAFTYYASDGGIETGFVDPQAGEFVFPPGRYVGADGQSLTMRATWRMDGPDHFTTDTEVMQGGQWRSHMRILYTRVPPTS
jgi:hypothetical protein